MTKLLLLDLDNTIRKSKSDAIFINQPEDQEIIAGVEDALSRYPNYIKIGVTNQGGCAAIDPNTGKPYKSVESAITEQQITLQLLPQLEYIYFAPTFDGLVCWKVTRQDAKEIKQQSIDEFGSFRKPGAGMLKMAIKYYSAICDDCLMVGDREEDEKAALAAGIPFTWAQDWLKG